MTQEEKQLLLKDITARLSYGVKTEYFFDEGCGTHRKEVGTLKGFYPKTTSIDGVDFILEINTPTGYTYYLHYDSWAIKPYLRPMSSMTVEEKIELCIICYLPDEAKTIDEKMYILKINMDGYDWLNAHHFDYRGLIEKGLALEAPKDMYNII